MPKKITVPASRLAKPDKTAKSLRKWNKRMERRIQLARKATQFTAQDFETTCTI